MTDITIVECPRDAMQGISRHIPAIKKINYLNILLQAGFHTLDFGSFVSPKAIPQLSDTEEVLKSLNLENSVTKLLAIVANHRGIEKASSFQEISYLGFPLSVSETFQQRNTNASIKEALKVVDGLVSVCRSSKKIPVVYLSMGFGNPYGDSWSEETVLALGSKVVEAGVPIVSLADTVGLAGPEKIGKVFSLLSTELPGVTWGVHLHAAPGKSVEKIKAALDAGCLRFDGALKGFGGCPMAEDELVGNIPTEEMISFFESRKMKHGILQENLSRCLLAADSVFSHSGGH